MSFDKDMSLTPISPTMPEPEQPSFEPTSIELSFSTGKGGAWDDRELIKASEAAMKEFHVSNICLYRLVFVSRVVIYIHTDFDLYIVTSSRSWFMVGQSYSSFSSRK